MATVIPIESLRRSPSAVLFEGRDDVALSVFVTTNWSSARLEPQTRS